MGRVKASEKMERIVRMLTHIKQTYDLEDLDILIYNTIKVKNEILIEEEMKRGKKNVRNNKSS